MAYPLKPCVHRPYAATGPTDEGEATARVHEWRQRYELLGNEDVSGLAGLKLAPVGYFCVHCLQQLPDLGAASYLEGGV